MDGSKTDPLVSVVIPTYGRDRSQLRAAVESVATQTYPRLELLVVDDSPDGVADVVSESAGDVPVQVLREGGHRSAGAARNTGIRACEGTFVAFLDDDDTWKSTKIRQQVDVAVDDPDVGLVVTGQRFIRDGETAGHRHPDLEGDVTLSLIHGARLCPFSAVMVRKSVIDDAGFIDEDLPVWEDIEWYLRLSQHCRVATVEVPLVRRRMGDHEQLTDDFELLRDQAYPQFREKHRSLAAEHGSASESRFLSMLAGKVAMHALSNGRYRDARRFSLKSIRADPKYPRGYLVFLLALGGRPVHRLASRSRRVMRRAFEHVG